MSVSNLARVKQTAFWLCSALVLASCGPAIRPSTAPRPTEPLVRVIPAPASLNISPAAPFEITRLTSVVVDASSAEVRNIGETFAALVRIPTGFPVPVSEAAVDTNTRRIYLRIAPNNSSLGEEGYELVVSSDSVRLVAYRPAGLFHGIQTLRQLLPADIEAEMGVARSTWTIPALTIVDRPRFAWRGAMLDVARHFLAVREVEQFIDLLALYKLNVLHLHLSDDQGWRILINSRPLLTSIGSTTQVGGGPGGFYTQQDYQTIVRYAQARYITVVPEIDMPSHINAGLVAYPDLSCGSRPPLPYIGTEVGFSSLCVDKEGTYALAEDVIREISAITPGPYFHIGGDEVKTLSNEQYTRFVERVQTIVNRYGKTMVGWEEIAKARLNPTTLVQQWKSDSATAALQYAAKLILSPGKKAYLDMKYTAGTELGQKWAALIEVRDAYSWDPASYMPGVGESNIVGVEAPLWSETLQNITAVEYLAMPRLPAIAEIGWTPQQARDWEGFRVRLATHAPRWHYLGVNYYRSPQIPW